jgi:LppM domain
MERKGWLALGIACLSVLLSGCRMNVITEIDSSGGGTLTTEVGMTSDEVAQLQSLGGEAGESVCSAFSSTAIDGGDAPAFTEETRGQETWCVARMPFADVDELEDLYQEMGTVRIRELTLREGLLVYDLEIDTQGSEQAMTPVGITWVLELPGKVGSHNAESAEGRRLTWTLEPGTLTEVRASSDLFAPSLPFGWGVTEVAILAGVGCVCCGGLLVLAGALVIALLRRKRTPPAASAEPARPLQTETR